MWRIKNMLTSTFMIGFSILMTYALAIGACMAILQSEFLKKGYIWFYRILIALNVILSIFYAFYFKFSFFALKLFYFSDNSFYLLAISSLALETASAFLRMIFFRSSQSSAAVTSSYK